MELKDISTIIILFPDELEIERRLSYNHTFLVALGGLQSMELKDVSAIIILFPEGLEGRLSYNRTLLVALAVSIL